MSYRNYYPSQILINKRIEKTELCGNVLDAVTGKKPNVRIRYLKEEEPSALSGKTLVLTENKGAWLKSCPGTTGNYLCCNYQILNFATNCSMICNYCILQFYFEQRHMTVYCNTDEMFRELDREIKKKNRPYLRIGTGEFTDSMCLDHLTGFSRMIVPYFVNAPRCILELKTKADDVRNLLKMRPDNRIIISWSMNAEPVHEKEEHGTATLSARLKAAQKCEAAGYKLGFHFDPIIVFEGWEAAYEKTVDRIFDHIRKPENVAWISLGCLRYPPMLNDWIRKKFPGSSLPFSEFIMGNDGKLRYIKPVRIDVYRKMNRWIQERAPGAVVYLCMESPSVWDAALGKAYKCNQPIAALLSKAI